MGAKRHREEAQRLRDELELVWVPRKRSESEDMALSELRWRADDIKLALGKTLPEHERYLLGKMVASIVDVGRHAAADLIEAGSIEEFGPNILTAGGNLLSIVFKRVVLLWTLTEFKWNLAHTAHKLLIGGGASAILRMIDDFGLRQVYEVAKKTGQTVRGRPKKDNDP